MILMNSQRLNNTIWNNEQIIKETKKEIKTFLKLNEDEGMTC